MSTQVQHRRGTAEQHEEFTGAMSEFTHNTTTNRIHVHDGFTAGGHATLMEADRGVAGGLATLDVSGGVPVAQLGNVVPPPIYSNIADVQQSDVPSEYSYLRTEVYDTAAFAGGALYKRAAAEPNHIGKVKSNDGAWWELVPENGTVSVLQLGAKADGIFDNAVIFNASQDVAVKTNVNEVLIPDVGSEYLLNSQVEIDQNGLIYRGVGRPRLKRNHAGNVVFLRGAGITWRDTVIYGNHSAFPTSEGTGIVIWNVHNDVIGNEVYSFRGWGILFFADATPVPCAWGRAIENYVHDVLSGGICTNNATDCIIGFNKTVDIGFEGITLDVYALRCTVVGNRVERSCTVTGVGAIGIDAAAHNSVVGNVITGTIAPDMPGITFQNNIDVSQYNSIVGNTIDGVTGHGIHLKKGVGLNGGGTFFTSVVGNNISNIGGNPIHIDAGCNDNNISGNVFALDKIINDNGDNNSVQGRNVNNVRSLTSSFTLTLRDDNVFVNASSGNVTITLPKISRYGAGKSKVLHFTRIDNSANTVTVVNAAGDTTVAHTVGPFSQMMLLSDGGLYWQRFAPT